MFKVIILNMLMKSLFTSNKEHEDWYSIVCVTVIRVKKYNLKSKVTWGYNKINNFTLQQCEKNGEKGLGIKWNM